MKEKRYFLDRQSFPLKAAVVCLLLAFVLRGVSGLLNRVVLEDRLTLFSFLLFLGSCLIYTLSLLLFGKKWLWLTVGPFVLGVMAFVARLFTFDNLLQEEVSVLRMLISILYYLIVTAIYSVTACGGMRGKWLLVPLFLCPLAAHVMLDILPAFRQGLAIPAAQILAELSILTVIIGMLFVSLAMKRQSKVPAGKQEKTEVVPPIPGNKLDEKPPVVTDPQPAEPEKAEEPVVSAPVQPEPEEPASAEEEKEIPEEEQSEKEPLSEPEEAAAAVEAEAAPPAEVKEPEAEEAEEFDPFAPSREPIRLTLDPFKGDDNSETDTEKTDTLRSEEGEDDPA